MAVEFDQAALLSRLRKAAMRGVVTGTEAVRTEAVSLVLQTPKTGRIYRRRGVEHQASAPGEPWASDTGYALSRIETVYDSSELVGRVNFGAKQAEALEFGTQTMQPRPVARPALMNKKDEIEKTVADEIRKELAR